MKLDNLACNSSSMISLRQRAFSTYHTYFAKKIVVDQWDHLMRELLEKHGKISG
jgi:hypothetical protein